LLTGRIKLFMNVAGTVTALRGGGVAAVFERQGKSLTVYDLDSMEAVLSAFVRISGRKGCTRH
jgi:hypothetical protein